MNPTHNISSHNTHIDKEIESAIEGLIASLPSAEDLDADQRRGILARYAAVLEGNFIYWMTGAYLSAKSDAARDVILKNLLEEVRDSHPAMLRKFTLAAKAIPTDSDIMAVHPDLTRVRLFVGRLTEVQVILMMTFFEGFIQRFMCFLAQVATLQGSNEQEYTDVHGVCDITHTQELLRALAAESATSGAETSTNLFEGVELLTALIRTIIFGAEIEARPNPTRAAAAAQIG